MNTTYPDMMFAAVMADDPELVYDLMPTPDADTGEVIVKIHAATVNFEDILYRHGRYTIQADLPHILGSDAVGEIVVLGEDVQGWAIGDRVILSDESLGIERHGTYAEYVAVSAEFLGRIPDDMDYQVAANVSQALCRAWSGLIYNAKIRKREVVVINHASTARGLAAIAVAKWKEATIIAIDHPEKFEQLREAGATTVLDQDSDDLLTLVLTISDGAGASLAVDVMGAATIAQSIEFLAFDGRVLSLASYSGDIAEINLQDLMSINGSIITPRDRLKAGDLEKLLTMLADKSLDLIVDSVLPMSQVNNAHQEVENDTAFGSIVLVPDSLL